MLCDAKVVESLLSHGLGESTWILSLCCVPGPRRTVPAQLVLGDLYNGNSLARGVGWVNA